MTEDEAFYGSTGAGETGEGNTKGSVEVFETSDPEDDEEFDSGGRESIIAPTTDEEVAAYRAEHGGMVVHAREAVDKLHLLEAAAEAKVTGDAHDLAEIVEALVERLPG